MLQTPHAIENAVKAIFHLVSVAPFFWDFPVLLLVQDWCSATQQALHSDTELQQNPFRLPAYDLKSAQYFTSCDS